MVFWESEEECWGLVCLSRDLTDRRGGVGRVRSGDL